MKIIIGLTVGVLPFLLWFYHATDTLVEKMCSRGGIRPLDDTSVELLSPGEEIAYILKTLFFFPAALAFLKALRKSMKRGDLDEESLRHLVKMYKEMTTALVVLGCIIVICQ